MYLPKTWKEVTVGKYIELYNLSQEDFDSLASFYVQILSILTDEDPIIFEEMNFDYFEILKNQIKFLERLPTNHPVQSINIEGTELELISFYLITLGEFIDMEAYLSDKIGNLLAMLAIVYRRFSNKNDIFTPPVVENYGSFVKHRQHLFNNQSMEDVYGIIDKYIAFRKEIFDSYLNLFNVDEPETEEEAEQNRLALIAEEEDEINLTITERHELEKAKEREKNINKWGFAAMALRLADNDLTKLPAILEMPLILTLNTLAMRKELKIQS